MGDSQLQVHDHPTSHHSNSTSSSSSSVPEILVLPDQLSRRQKKKKAHRLIRPNGAENGAQSMHPRPADKPISKDMAGAHGIGCHDKACCQCAARFTADCAAVCCCPLALLHLLALTFIKLPSTVAWRTLVKLKKRLCLKRSPRDVQGQDGPRPTSNSQKEPSEGSDPLPHVLRFDSQKLLKHFEADHLGFGGLSIKRE